jgi:hypothetical protein
LCAKAWIDRPRQPTSTRLCCADLEDEREARGVENRLYPMRELLGDLLMEHGQAGEAFKAEASMKNARGASRPWRRQSRTGRWATSESDNIFTELARLTKDADTDRPGSAPPSKQSRPAEKMAAAPAGSRCPNSDDQREHHGSAVGGA